MNILLIMPDALRATNLGCCGYSKNTSPFMDKLAKEGVVFKNTIAQTAHTHPGVVSIYTGLYPTTHCQQTPKDFAAFKEVGWSKEWRNTEVRKKWKAPLNILRENGYTTGGKGSSCWWPLGYLIETNKMLDKLMGDKIGRPFFMMCVPYYTHIAYNAVPDYDKLFLSDGDKLTDNFKKYMDMVKTTGHGYVLNPKLVDKKYHEAKINKSVWKAFSFLQEDRPSMMALYDGAVRNLDMEAERYVKKLEELGILDDTLIIITPDHGEEILERGSLGHASCSMAGTLYDENIRTPLIMRYPKALPQGKVIETQVSQVDIMPTIFDILGYSMPKLTEGHSLLPLIKGEDIDFEEETHCETIVCGMQTLDWDKRMKWAVRTPQWKLIYSQDTNGNYYELYNLKNDPAEKVNLIDKETKIADELKKKLRKREI
ncbi:sulfatase [bacterium]|nr:sulfatase [bacterium]